MPNAREEPHCRQSLLGHSTGGIDLGLERAGMDTRWFVEWDAHCQNVLRRHWPGLPVYGDITAVDWGSVDPVDVLAGGFPCQPVSVAGRALAQADDRWLWPAFADAIGALRPRYVLVENVPGLLQRGLGIVLGDLAALGYDAEWECIPAAAVGAPHRRDRLWLVAHAASQRGDERSRVGVNGVSPHELADAHGAGLEGRTLQPERPDQWAAGPFSLAYPDSESLGRIAESRGQRGQWLAEPDVGGALDGFSAWLDGYERMTQAHMLVLAYANATQARPGEVLRSLRREVGAQVREPARGSVDLSPQEVLLTYLRELEDRCEAGDVPLESPEDAGARLRGMWEANVSACTSCGRRPRSQHARQHPDPLHALPRLLAQDAGATWAAYRRTDASPLLAYPWGQGWEDGVARVTDSVPHRVDRLRALGNAVVPQVVEWIGRRIVAFDEGRKVSAA